MCRQTIATGLAQLGVKGPHTVLALAQAPSRCFPGRQGVFLFVHFKGARGAPEERLVI